MRTLAQPDVQIVTIGAELVVFTFGSHVQLISGLWKRGICAVQLCLL
jgi:hypothetical protein